MKILEVVKLNPFPQSVESQSFKKLREILALNADPQLKPTSFLIISLSASFSAHCISEDSALQYVRFILVIGSKTSLVQSCSHISSPSGTFKTTTSTSNPEVLQLCQTARAPAQAIPLLCEFPSVTEPGFPFLSCGLR